MRSKFIILFALLIEKLWFVNDIIKINFRGKNESCIPIKISEKFITGDYFKFLSDYEINNSTIDSILNRNFLKLDKPKNLKNTIYFVEISKTDSTIFNSFTHNIENDSKLIFHNGDKIEEYNIKDLITRNIIIFAVNSIDNSDITALPIGLENLSLNKNGKINEFIEIPFLKKSINNNRSIILCVNFRLRTNFAERINALQDLSTNELASFFWFKSPKKIHEIYRKSLFVVSPPGNGVDCHRTWEAMYNGAAAIVIRNKLDANLIKGLPILVVDSYKDLMNIKKSDFSRIYSELWNNSNLEKLDPKYWKEIINGK